MSWTFKCSGCSERIEYAAYAIAQLSSGNDLTYTHPGCGARTELTPEDLDKVSEDVSTESRLDKAERRLDLRCSFCPPNRAENIKHRPKHGPKKTKPRRK